MARTLPPPGDVFGRSAQAQALVEFALVLLVLCALFVGALDYGRVMNTYLVTVHATREAARIASIAGSTTSAVQNAARNAAQDSIAPGALVVTCRAANLERSAVGRSRWSSSRW